MAELEARMDALEDRVDTLTIDVRRVTATSTAAAADAAAAHAAHRHNTRLLTALRETQAEHSEMLATHSEMLAEHSEMLAEHSRAHRDHRVRFDQLDATLARVTVGLHTIESLLRRALGDDADA